MTETNQNIPQDRDDRYVAGDKTTLRVTVVDADGDPKDLSDADARFALAEYAGADPLVDKRVGEGIEIVEPTAGRLDVTVAGSDTADLGTSDGRDYYYELRIIDDTGDPTTVATGEWTIHADTASFA